MKYYIIAGEASGDTHGAQLAKQLKSNNPSAEVRGIGGAKMVQASTTLLFHFNEIAVMGFWNVARKSFILRRCLQRCKKDISQFRPDAIVLIDSAGFNLRIAQYTKNLDPGIKIFYFIPPKIWAWGGWRIKQLRNIADQLVVLFPFEQEYFEGKGLNAHYYGYPENDVGLSAVPGPCNQIALLPGSRLQEIKSVLPVMLELADNFPDYHFTVCGIDIIKESQYTCYKFPKNVELCWNCTSEVLEGSIAAVVTSGTATLQACYAGVPQAVVYKTNWINYLIAKVLIQVKFISLVNLVLNKKVVNELIQSNFNADSLTLELDKLISDQNYRKAILNSYEEIKVKLKGERVYEKICDLIIKTA